MNLYYSWDAMKTKQRKTTVVVTFSLPKSVARNLDDYLKGRREYATRSHWLKRVVEALGDATPKTDAQLSLAGFAE